MTCYAIKHLPSGGFLPQRERKGHTFEEPRVDCIPRLFAKESSAKLALIAWLKGEWVHHDTVDSHTGEYDEYCDPIPKEGRNPKEMAVVKIAMRERP